MSAPVPDALHELAIAAARIGGRVAADGFGTRYEVERKADLSEVTQFDRAAEAAIIEHLRAARPDDVFLGEEAVGDTYRESADRVCWIIDPIDGTRNFTRGSLNFACSIGVLHEGRLLAGAIYQPMTDGLWSAALGGGAWHDGRRLEVAPLPQPSGDRKLLVGIPSARHANSAAWVERILARHVVRNLGSSALHLAMVASGQLDATLLNNCKLWDIAGGALIITEAGGTVSSLRGDLLLPIDLAGYNGEMIPTLAGLPVAHVKLLAMATTASSDVPE